MGGGRKGGVCVIGVGGIHAPDEDRPTISAAKM